MNSFKKYLGLDYGDRRVGVAISNPEGSIAFSRGFFENKNLDELMKELSQLCLEEGVFKIILGWPLHTDGQEGYRAELTKVFANEIKKYLPQIELEFFDERFTTQWAVGKLQQAGVRAREQKGQKDGVAAQILLQTYLDGRK